MELEIKNMYGYNVTLLKLISTGCSLVGNISKDDCVISSDKSQTITMEAPAIIGSFGCCTRALYEITTEATQKNKRYFLEVNCWASLDWDYGKYNPYRAYIRLTTKNGDKVKSTQSTEILSRTPDSLYVTCTTSLSAYTVDDKRCVVGAQISTDMQTGKGKLEILVSNSYETVS
jgi:hypothetical protein